PETAGGCGSTARGSRRRRSDSARRMRRWAARRVWGPCGRGGGSRDRPATPGRTPASRGGQRRVRASWKYRSAAPRWTQRHTALAALVPDAPYDVERRSEPARRRLPPRNDRGPDAAPARAGQARGLDGRADAHRLVPEPEGPAEDPYPVALRDRAAHLLTLLIADLQAYVLLARVDAHERPLAQRPAEAQPRSTRIQAGLGEGERLRRAAVRILGVDEPVAVVVLAVVAHLGPRPRHGGRGHVAGRIGIGLEG